MKQWKICVSNSSETYRWNKEVKRKWSRRERIVTGVARALEIDAKLTLKNTDKDLRKWYCKWNGYQEAWAKIQRLRESGQWKFNVGKTELINLFGKCSMWTSHVTPAMKDIHDYRAMVEWLERGEDEDEPFDLALCGELQSRAIILRIWIFGRGKGIWKWGAKRRR